jgi:hypothetical protein
VPGGRLNHFGDGLASPHVVEETEAVFVPVLHGSKGVFEGAAGGDDEVALVETGADE